MTTRFMTTPPTLRVVIALVAVIAISGCVPQTSTPGVQTVFSSADKEQIFNLVMLEISKSIYPLPQDPNITVGWSVEDANLESGFIRASIPETENWLALGLTRTISVTLVPTSDSRVQVVINTGAFDQRSVELAQRLARLVESL